MPKLHKLQVTTIIKGDVKKYECVDSIDSILMRLANYLKKVKSDTK